MDEGGVTDLARNSDPETSHQAAARARSFLADHEALIVGVLGLPGSCYDVARRTGLDHVQVDRRIAKLIEDGRIVATGETKLSPAGRACRVYRQVTLEEQEIAKHNDLFAALK